VDHTAPPGLPAGRAGWALRWGGLATALPDMQTQIQQSIENGEWVATRSKVKATPAGVFMGLQTTGKSFEVNAFDMMKISGGQVVEHWGLGDLGAMIAQLGLKVGAAG
jgi:predicted ester cyclase